MSQIILYSFVIYFFKLWKNEVKFCIKKNNFRAGTGFYKLLKNYNKIDIKIANDIS